MQLNDSYYKTISFFIQNDPITSMKFVHNDNSIPHPLIHLSEGTASAAGQCSILVNKQ